MTRLPLVAAIALSLGLPVFAVSAQDPTQDGDARRLDQIQVTATRREEGVLEVPMGITVVDAEDIVRQAPQTVADLFHGEPGTYVQQTTPGQGVVIIRGLKGSEVLHIVDGFRLNNALFRNAPNQYIALVDPMNLDRVEAVRGPMSTLYGSDAMGGVLQFLTPEPRYAGSEWQSDGQIRTRYSSADESTHSRVAFQGGREGFGIAGGISYQDVGTLRVGGGDELPFTGFTQRGGDLKVLFAPGNGHELMVSGQFSEQPNTPRHDALVPGFGQEQAESAESFFKPQERRFGRVRYRYTEATPISDSIEIHVGQQEIVDDRTTRDTGSPNREIEQNSSTLRGFTGQFAKRMGDAHYLTYGWEYYQDEVNSCRKRFNIDTGVTSARPARFPTRFGPARSGEPGSRASPTASWLIRAPEMRSEARSASHRRRVTLPGGSSPIFRERLRVPYPPLAWRESGCGPCSASSSKAGPSTSRTWRSCCGRARPPRGAISSRRPKGRATGARPSRSRTGP